MKEMRICSGEKRNRCKIHCRNCHSSGDLWRSRRLVLESGCQTGTERQEEARLENEAIRAIYVEAGDILKEMVFVDMDKKTVFKAAIPKEGIYNKNDKLIAGDTLENGDMVKIYGDRNMTRSIPAQYPGITKMKRNGRASLEELQPYLEIANELLCGDSEEEDKK